MTDREMKPKTRLENFLAKIAKDKNADYDMRPRTWLEKRLNVIAGDKSEICPVSTRLEYYLDQIAKNGGGYPEPTGTKSITENGRYDVKDYAEAEVIVPAPSVNFAGINITNNTEYTARVNNSLVIDEGKLKTQQVAIAPNGEGMASVDYGAYGSNVYYRLFITILQGANKAYAISPANGTNCSILYQAQAGNHKLLEVTVDKTGVVSTDKFPAITITEDQ